MSRQERRRRAFQAEFLAVRREYGVLRRDGGIAFNLPRAVLRRIARARAKAWERPAAEGEKEAA